MNLLYVYIGQGVEYKSQPCRNVGRPRLEYCVVLVATLQEGLVSRVEMSYTSGIAG